MPSCALPRCARPAPAETEACSCGGGSGGESGSGSRSGRLQERASRGIDRCYYRDDGGGSDGDVGVGSGARNVAQSAVADSPTVAAAGHAAARSDTKPTGSGRLCLRPAAPCATW